MSRIVIRDIVMPIVEKIVMEQMRHAGYGHPIVQDASLEDFLEEEMRRHFGVIGANECQHLRDQLEEARKNDPYAFEFLLRRLVGQYVKLAARIRVTKERERLEKEPPDRFLEQLKRYYLLQQYQRESDTS